VLAVLNKDYEKAYGYLAELENKPTFDEFRRAYLNGDVNPNDQAVDIGAKNPGYKRRSTAWRPR
jgi:hypothetical protein